MADATPIIIKKKKAHGHGHHGGAWKVAYADFVTAMMAFFMVMWIMGMSESTRTTVAGYFNDPLGFTKNEPKSRVNIQPSNGSPYAMAGTASGTGNDEINNERQKYQKLKEDIESAVEQAKTTTTAAAGTPAAEAEAQEVRALFRNVDMKITNEGLLIELCENSGAVFFEVGSAEIRPGALKLISRLAPILSKTGRKLVVEGHTDARPFPANGRGYDNWDLSNDRAQSLRHALISFGVQSDQFFGVHGYAATRLKRQDDPYHFSNRRVSLLLPFRVYSGERAPGLPKDLLEAEIQGAFQQPVGVEP